MAATAIALAGTPAHADVRWWDIGPENPPDLDPGNSTLFSATGADSLLTNRDAQLRCATVTVRGEAFDAADTVGDPDGGSRPSGHPAPDTVAEVTSSSWTDCRFPLGITLIYTQVGTWGIQAIDQPGGPGTTVNVAITDIVLNISGPLCAAQIVGAAGGGYDNDGTLTIDEPGSGQLAIQPGANCLGILVGGDRPGLSASLAVDPDDLRIDTLPVP